MTINVNIYKVPPAKVLLMIVGFGRFKTSCLLTLGLLASGLAQAAPSDLPAVVAVQTRTETFNIHSEFALRDGRIWHRPNVLYGHAPGEWALFGGSGIPQGEGHLGRPFEPAGRLVELSADGYNLVAIDETRKVYYVKSNTLKWNDTWGPFDYVLRLPENTDAHAMSHRGPLVGGYEDIAGNRHLQTAGVTTYYALTDEGTRLRFADPWLGSSFNYSVCLPERGRFRAASMAASASTLFVVDEGGRFFTRLADYDTVGDDPVLPYTYDPAEAGKGVGARTTRLLPPEDWRAQPRITPELGRPTRGLTIFQTAPLRGNKNAGRELRVEGVNARGETGYFRKLIYDESWQFVVTGEPLREPFLAGGGAPGPERLADYSGWLEGRGVSGRAEVELRGFHADCGPAELRIRLGSSWHAFTLHVRRPYMTRQNLEPRGAFRGTIVVTAADREAARSDPALALLLDKTFKNHGWQEIDLNLHNGWQISFRNHTRIPFPARFEGRFTRK